MASTRASKRLAVSSEREPAMATPAKVAKVSDCESNHVSNGATPGTEPKGKGEVHVHVCVHVNACAMHAAGEPNGKPSVKDLLGSLEYGPAPESPAVAEAWLDDHGRSLGHFIGNQWIKPEGRNTYDTFNPATGQLLAATIQGMGVLTPD